MSARELLLILLAVLALAAAIGIAVALRRARLQTLDAYAARAEALAAREPLETEIARLRAQLDALGESTSDPLMLLDDNRRVTWANRATWALYTNGESQLGGTFIALVRDYELNQAVADALAGHRQMSRQAVAGERMLRIWATPIDGFSGAAVAMQDVTELQRLGRARRDFVANISHELRTPLANIDLAAQMLRQMGVEDAALNRRMLDQIQVQVQTISQLSQEMMDLAQIESGQVLLKLVPTELEPVVRRCVTNLLPQAAVKKQHVALVVPSGLIALIDEAMIGRAVNNLVHNAVKFTQEGGEITVTAEADGDDIRICVSDNGPGIPKDELRRVFERFYKADRARSRGGTGLGLAIARHIIEGHGGKLTVDSTPGKGAQFCFTVPKA